MKNSFKLGALALVIAVSVSACGGSAKKAAADSLAKADSIAKADSAAKAAAPKVDTTAAKADTAKKDTTKKK